jgi:hypothetical protein
MPYRISGRRSRPSKACAANAMSARELPLGAELDFSESLLRELLQMPLEVRLDRVALDVRKRSPRFRTIPAHDLAAALGVPDPHPSNISPRVASSRHALWEVQPAHHAEWDIPSYVSKPLPKYRVCQAF